MSETFQRYNFQPPATENFLKRPLSSSFDLSSTLSKRPYFSDISYTHVSHHNSSPLHPHYSIPKRIEETALNEVNLPVLTQQNNNSPCDIFKSATVDANSINRSSQSIGMKRLNLKHFRSNTHSILEYLLVNISKILNSGKLSMTEQRTLKALTSVVLLSMCHTSANVACRKIIEIYKQHKHLGEPERYSLFSALLRCAAVFFHVQKRNGSYAYVDEFDVSEKKRRLDDNMSHIAEKRRYDESHCLDQTSVAATQKFPNNNQSSVNISNMPLIHSRSEVSHLPNNELNCKAYSASERDSKFTENFCETIADSNVHSRAQTASAESLSHEGDVNHSDILTNGILVGSGVSEHFSNANTNMCDGVVGTGLHQNALSEHMFEDQTCYLRSEEMQNIQTNENSKSGMIIVDSPMSPTPESPPNVSQHNNDLFIPSLNQIHELLSDPNQLQKTLELLFNQRQTQEFLSPQMNPPPPSNCGTTVAMPALRQCPPHTSPQTSCMIPPPIFNFPPPCYNIGLTDNTRSTMRPVNKAVSPPPYNSTLAHMQGPIRPLEVLNSSQNFNVQHTHPGFWSESTNFSHLSLSNPTLVSSECSNYDHVRKFDLNLNSNNNNNTNTGNNRDCSFDSYDALPAMESNAFEDVSPPYALNSGCNLFPTEQCIAYNRTLNVPLHFSSDHLPPYRLFHPPHVNSNQFPQNFSIPPPNIHIPQSIYQCQQPCRFLVPADACNLGFNGVRYPSQNLANPTTTPCHLRMQRNLTTCNRFNVHNVPTFFGNKHCRHTPHTSNDSPRWLMNSSSFQFGNRNVTRGKEQRFRSQMIIDQKSTMKVEFTCKRCERRFPVEKLYLSHMQNHIKCTIPGCDYEASPKLVNLHFENVHLTGVFEKMKEIDMDNVQQWIQERKRNYPTLDKSKPAADMDEKNCVESTQLLSKCNGTEMGNLSDGGAFLDLGDLAELNTKTNDLIHKLRRDDRRKRTKGGAEPFEPSRRKFYKASLLEKLLAPEIRRERSFVMQCIDYILAKNFFDDACKELDRVVDRKPADSEKENCKIFC